MSKLIALMMGLGVAVGSAAAAETPKPPAGLVSAKASFAAAVSANNEAGAAALTSFPLKNTVYKSPPKLTRAAFAGLFADYRQMSACIKAAPLVFERAGWLIECDGNILHFGLRGGRWLHTEYENINE